MILMTLYQRQKIMANFKESFLQKCSKSLTAKFHFLNFKNQENR